MAKIDHRAEVSNFNMHKLVIVFDLHFHSIQIICGLRNKQWDDDE